MKSSSVVAGFLTLMSVAHASVIQEQEPNNDINTAQQIPIAAFTLGYNPIISNSATLPWVTIEGTGDGTYDFYSFEVPNTGMIASIFDVDNTGIIDSFLTLYGPNGNYLAYNDDDGGDPGSSAPFDSYLTYTFNTPGTYTVAVGECCRSPHQSSTNWIPNGATYKLHISLGYSEAQLRAAKGITDPPQEEQPGEAYGMGDPHFKV
ncbi:Hemolysin-type calcium-binding repeat (2 copies) [Seminavis robusta]|uniref:Hemolysin-type calcium-binding repeat (2 copies) n=1 Tax=Seminavis robusta TaxID=568900 RepID=A0A9N8HIN7_9STRA|nr:Hemolysin-type calcium-binding repeat (2 copies) [Seminavis robusta]|eukprot:Sro798_g203950.1 Hemolysin-type calcium-binding repeat (2 copies) (205) ;mRNA; r:1088-1778